MRVAYATIAVLALIFSTTTINAVNAKIYASSDMSCWNGFGGTNTMTNPQAFEQITIPKYAKSITLSVGKGLGDVNVFNLRNCAYNTCTTPQLYMTTCPSISVYGFGLLDLTDVLVSSATYNLRLDGMAVGQNGQSVQVLASTLTIEKQFLYDISKNFQYLPNKTILEKVASVYSGEGKCSISTLQNSDFNATNLSISNGSEVTASFYNFANQSIDFNCTENYNYTLSVNLPAVQTSTVIEQNQTMQSNLTTQFIKANAQFYNPTLETTYENVLLNFSLGEIPVQNTSGNLQTTFNLMPQENKTLNSTLQTNAGVQISIPSTKVQSANSTTFWLVKKIQITNLLPFPLRNLNTSEVMQLSQVQNLKNSNWTCIFENENITVQQAANVTVKCYKEKILNFNLIPTAILDATLDYVLATGEITISNFENEAYELDLNSLLTQNYSRYVNASANLSLNPNETRAYTFNFTGRFLNQETTSGVENLRSFKTLRIWNETNFNVENARGSISFLQNWTDLKLEVYNFDHWSDLTTNATCTSNDTYSQFNLENKTWKTCLNSTTASFQFIIPHFSTVILKVSGVETVLAEQQGANSGSASIGSNSGGAGANAKAFTFQFNKTNTTSDFKLPVDAFVNNSKILNIENLNSPLKSVVEIQIPKTLEQGEVYTFNLTQSKVPASKGVVIFTSPNGIIKTQFINQGKVEFLASETGNWTVEYADVKKSFTVKSKAKLQAELNTQVKTSPTSGFTFAFPQVGFEVIVQFALLFILIAAALHVFKNQTNGVKLNRTTNGNSVTLIVSNESTSEITNLTLTEVLGEEVKIQNESEPHFEFRELIYGDLYQWSRNSLKPKEKWTINYQANKTPLSKQCELNAKGVNNESIVIKT